MPLILPFDGATPDIHESAFIAPNATIIGRVRIGAHAMTAMCSLLFADVPPFVMAQGQPAGARSMNFEGLRRRGFDAEAIARVKHMHKLLYRSDLPLRASVEKIAALTTEGQPSPAEVQIMLDFLANTNPQRGIVR